MFIRGADPTAGGTTLNDPHVETLTYRVVKPDNVTFHNPPAVVGEFAAFRYRLEHDILTAEMKEHFATLDAAREPVEEFLRAWELDAALRADKPVFGFELQQFHVIDRNPSPSNPVKGKVAAACDMFLMADEATVQKVSPAYPPPPSGLKPSLDTETMWHHVSAIRRSRMASRVAPAPVVALTTARISRIVSIRRVIQFPGASECVFLCRLRAIVSPVPGISNRYALRWRERLLRSLDLDPPAGELLPTQPRLLPCILAA